MNEKSDIQIHETAFLTSTFRSFDELLSRDPYAKLWNSPKNDVWIDRYLEEVCNEETYAHCLRNRFFLDTIENLAKTGEIEALINFGCGMSMYPFIMEPGLIHIEIDQPQIIDFKRENIKEFQKQGLLPEREVNYISVDFSTDYQELLKREIETILQGKSAFILIEGVLFFLNQEIVDSLFKFFESIQNKGDYIGSGSFQDYMLETTAYQKMIDFLEREVEEESKQDYLCLPDAFYHSLESYDLLDQQDYFSLSKTYRHNYQLDRDTMLNETFYILKKKV